MDKVEHKDDDPQRLQELIHLAEVSASSSQAPDTEASSSNNQDHDRSHGKVNLSPYRFELARRESFTNWPLSFIGPNVLAAAGFYHTGISDCVKCFTCDIEISRWFEGDDPMYEHQRWGFSCRFVHNLSCGNVPIGVHESNVPISSTENEVSYESADKEVQAHKVQCHPIVSSDFPGGGAGVTSSNKISLSSRRLNSTIRPRYYEFAIYDIRLKSFESCPKSISHIKEQLAQAGFFVTGTKNYIRCYHCGLEFKDWKSEDDPWKLHTKLSQDCYYVLMVKGRPYINDIIGENLKASMEEMHLSSTIQANEDSTNQETVMNTAQVTELNSLQDSVSITEPPRNSQFQPKVIDKDVLTCRICFIEERGVLFFPCGHMVSCVKCAVGINTCFICQQNISLAVHAIIA